MLKNTIMDIFTQLPKENPSPRKKNGYLKIQCFTFLTQ